MAKANTGAPDVRRAGVASSDSGQAEFTAATNASPWVQLQGRFFMGAWSGATPPVGAVVQLQCSPDGGTTILNVSLPDGSDNAWNVPVTQFPEGHAEPDFVYRLYCSALTSGTVAWRLSQ